MIIVNGQARESHLMWHDNGKATQRVLYDNMKKDRSYLKYVFRKCKTSNTRKLADSLANKLLSTTIDNFGSLQRRLTVIKIV